MLNFPDRGYRVYENSILKILFPEQSIPFHGQYVFHHLFHHPMHQYGMQSMDGLEAYLLLQENIWFGHM